MANNDIVLIVLELLGKTDNWLDVNQISQATGIDKHLLNSKALYARRDLFVRTQDAKPKWQLSEFRGVRSNADLPKRSFATSDRDSLPIVVGTSPNADVSRPTCEHCDLLVPESRMRNSTHNDPRLFCSSLCRKNAKRAEERRSLQTLDRAYFAALAVLNHPPITYYSLKEN